MSVSSFKKTKKHLKYQEKLVCGRFENMHAHGTIQNNTEEHTYHRTRPKKKI